MDNLLDKFVTFEQYAEKLSGEASQLRTKVSKEQKETKRLSGIVTLTAAEKNKIQSRESFSTRFTFLFLLTGR